MKNDERARLRSGAVLREQVRARRERGAVANDAGALDLDPRSTYEVLTRQMVADLADELREIRQRVNGLIFVTIGAFVADVVLRVVR